MFQIRFLVNTCNFWQKLMIFYHSRLVDEPTDTVESLYFLWFLGNVSKHVGTLFGINVTKRLLANTCIKIAYFVWRHIITIPESFSDIRDVVRNVISAKHWLEKSETFRISNIQNILHGMFWYLKKKFFQKSLSNFGYVFCIIEMLFGYVYLKCFSVYSLCYSDCYEVPP